MRKFDFHKRRTRSFKSRRRALDRVANLGRKALGVHERGDDAHAFLFDAGASRSCELGRDILGRGVVLVMPARYQGVHGKRHIFDCATEGANLVERAAERYHSVTRCRPIRGFEANNAAERCRLAD